MPPIEALDPFYRYYSQYPGPFFAPFYRKVKPFNFFQTALRDFMPSIGQKWNSQKGNRNRFVSAAVILLFVECFLECFLTGYFLTPDALAKSVKPSLQRDSKLRSSVLSQDGELLAANTIRILKLENLVQLQEASLKISAIAKTLPRLSSGERSKYFTRLQEIGGVGGALSQASKRIEFHELFYAILKMNPDSVLRSDGAHPLELMKDHRGTEELRIAIIEAGYIPTSRSPQSFFEYLFPKDVALLESNSRDPQASRRKAIVYKLVSEALRKTERRTTDGGPRSKNQSADRASKTD